MAKLTTDHLSGLVSEGYVFDHGRISVQGIDGVLFPFEETKSDTKLTPETFKVVPKQRRAYCVVTVESTGRQVPISYLKRIKDKFSKRYGGGNAATVVAKSLNKEFGSKLKEQMQYCIDHPEQMSKLAKMKAQVSEVKGVMMENIEKDAEKYKLGHLSHFHYLNQSRTYELEGVSNAEEYIKTRRAMEIIGISHDEQEVIYRTLAAIVTAVTPFHTSILQYTR